jgi:hypothetical protein
MATRKTPDQILDTAADILEKHGWVTEACYDSEVGGFCALGAIAKAVYPKMSNQRIDDVAYLGNPNDDPRHVEAVNFFGGVVSGKRFGSDDDVCSFNDQLPSGIARGERACWRADNYGPTVVDEKVRLKSSRKVVAKLRAAALKYRKQQAGSSSPTNNRQSRSKSATAKAAA